jgi:ligand-binding sensor domain-containing protein
MKRIWGGGLLWVAAVSLLLLPPDIRAHNGAATVALPVTGIEVDGYFSDWPDNLAWNRLQYLAWNPLEDSNDLQGRFAVGYSADENALYVAVEVRDESLVVGGENPEWNAVDGCELYVDVGHSEKGVDVGQYQITGMVSEVYRGIRREDFRVSAQRSAGKHRYEWRVDIGGHSRGEVRLRPGMILGLDVGSRDKDADGSFTQTAWGEKWIGDRFSSNALGDVMLVGPSGESGFVEGRLVRADGRADAHRLVELRSLDKPGQWLRTRADEEGFFALTPMVGRYRLTAGSLSEFEVEVKVEPGQRIRLAEGIMPPPRGREVKAGPGGRQVQTQGRTLRAGPGRWNGAWRTLGVADGIPDATVTDVFQDSEGNLWFSTGGGGVVRYDGEEMTVYTAADGLAGDLVSAICQGADGDMWFAMAGDLSSGVSGGVSRFDGKWFTAFTNQDGLPGFEVLDLIQDKQGHWWFGTNAGLCRFDGQHFTTFTIADGLPADQVNALALGGEGGLWIGTGAGVARFDGRYFQVFVHEGELGNMMDVEDLLVDSSGVLWVAGEPGIGRYDDGDFSLYTTRDGLISKDINVLLEDRDGNMWAGVEGGVNRFDGKQWTSFIPAGGLAHQVVGAICQDRSGDMWFGSGYARHGDTISGNGVSQYVGDEFLSRTTEAGVMALDEDHRGRIWLGTWNGVRYFEGGEVEAFEPIERYINRVLTDRQGRVWFSTPMDGAYVYDDGDITHYTTRDGLATNRLWGGQYEDREGGIWLGSWTEGGVSRFDGKKFVRFAMADSLIDDRIDAFVEDNQGRMWFGTRSGVSRLEGKNWRSSPADSANFRSTHFTTADGLCENKANSAMEDHRGFLWFGSIRGVSRFDGEKFTCFTTADGLSHNHVLDIMEDRQGHLWFSTFGGGVSRYDGRVFQTLLQRDGLVHNGVHEVVEGRDGSYWIATEGGFTRFRPRISPPRIRITRVVAGRDFPPDMPVRLPSTQDYLAFEFQGSSFKTRPEQIAYVYRLDGYDVDWQVTRQRQVVYRDLPIGEYLFEVQAVDRNLTYSDESATVEVEVHLPYGQMALWGLLGLTLAGALVSGRIALNRRLERDQAREALMLELEEELQTAHDMQMRLMPEESPRIPGFDVAGVCIPANHVGGDFYQYFPEDGKLAIAMADVTGHAMAAAVPVMMFSGLLKTEIKHAARLEDLFVSLNQTLYESLESRTYVCFVMGELDLANLTLRLSNSGCPYPFHFRAATGEVEELQVDAYPLGGRRDSR